LGQSSRGIRIKTAGYKSQEPRLDFGSCSWMQHPMQSIEEFY